jgi:hypothetical protein
LATVPRPDWRLHVERDLGFAFHTIRGTEQILDGEEAK